MPDAYHLSNPAMNRESYVVDDLDELDADERLDVEPLTLLWSVDHGLRTGDETSALIGQNCADMIMTPILEFLWSREVFSWEVDYVDAMVEALGDDDGPFPWDGEGWVDDLDRAGTVTEWSYEMQEEVCLPFIVESSAETGMTWGYRVSGEPFDVGGEPNTDDLVIQPNNSVRTVDFGATDPFPTELAARHYVREMINANGEGFHPNVWSVSDHGNYVLLDPSADDFLWDDGSTEV